MRYEKGARVQWTGLLDQACTGTVACSYQRASSAGHPCGPVWVMVVPDTARPERPPLTMDSTWLTPLHTPLCATRAEALCSEGLVYVHWKGGVYRLLTYVRRGEEIPDAVAIVPTWGDEGLPLQDLVVYEHLWPHAHQYYVRPASEFFDHEARTPQDAATRNLRRFTPYERGQLAFTRLSGDVDRAHARGLART